MSNKDKICGHGYVWSQCGGSCPMPSSPFYKKQRVRKPETLFYDVTGTYKPTLARICEDIDHPVVISGNCFSLNEVKSIRDFLNEAIAYLESKEGEG